ncbi:MAG: DUF3352 domain-containing protein [Flavobacteriaceae bacterium]|nr:DUF3352 domain-containing protein [Flavobacteriaceae bacterium]
MTKKIFLWTFLILILGIGGYIAYALWLKKTQNLDAMQVIPADALYIIETSQPIKSWKSISKSKVWQHIKHHPTFAEIGRGADAMDSLITDNDQLFAFLGERETYISAHKTTLRDYDFLYVVDMQKGAKFDFLQTMIEQIVKTAGWRPTDHEYKKYTISDLRYKNTGNVLHLCIVENQLVCSYTGKLVENAIDAIEEPSLAASDKFREIADRTPDGGLFKLFVNADRFDDFMQCYQQPLATMTLDISQILRYTGLSLNVADDYLKMQGVMNLNDSLESYLKAMLLNGNGKISAAEIIPETAAFYTALGFADFPRFMDQFEQLMQRDSMKWEGYKKNYHLLEKLLNLKIRDEFVSWIGSEVGYVIMPPHDSLLVKDFALVIKANDIEKAKEHLKNIHKKLKRRSPLKFRSKEYNGYEINEMRVKGFFKLLFGKLFDKFEKPYYVIIDDYVVFSNNDITLRTFIDAKTNEKTLANNERFKDVHDNFAETGSLFTYINMPSYLPLSRESMSSETFHSMQKNKDYINCFNTVGFGLKGNDKYFDVKLYSYFKLPDTSAAKLSEEVMMDSMTIADSTLASPLTDEGWKKEFYPDGKTKSETAVDEEGVADGVYREFYPDGTWKVKGKYREGKQTGTWKYYDESGEFIRKEDFEDEK